MDTKKVWQAILSEIEISVSRGTFLTFFSSTEFSSYENGVVTISCPNSYSSTMIEERYYGLIKSVLAKHLKEEKFSLVFVVSHRIAKKTSNEEVGPLFSETENFQETKITSQYVLKQDFTFETFAVSGSNQLAHAAATAVAKNPGTAYNPLFLWGGVGVGKTHLMQAVGNALLQKNRLLRVVYCAGEEFTNEIIEAIRNKKTAAFKEHYRKAGVLLIDDVQFIAGKQTVQEEFFHTFNAVHRAGGQIILTSDRPPSEISRLEDRLRSRFEGGMTVDISPPDFELRTAILLIKAKRAGREIPIDVAKALAANITDTRKLEGTLTKMFTISEMKKMAITPDLANEVLGSTPKTLQKSVTAKEVIDVVCNYYNLRQSVLKSDKRDRPIAEPRQILMYLLKNELKMPYMEIGGVIGGRDHTTIMYGVEKISKMLLTSDKLREDVDNIKRKLFQ